jgi:hypothetical protein
LWKPFALTHTDTYAVPNNKTMKALNAAEVRTKWSTIDYAIHGAN